MMFRVMFLSALIACSGGSKAAPVGTGTSNGNGDKSGAEAKSVQFDRAHISAELDRYLANVGRKWGEAQAFTGYAHLVSGGEVLYSKGFGYADRATKRPHTADTSFRIGSVTKQFTSAAIMLLEQEGKLEVTDTINTHLPDYPAEVGGKVTIHQLLNHTSGIPSYTAMKEVLDTRDKARTVAEMLALFKDEPLEFEPGSQWKYNNSGYVLLGAIIEAISGTTYAEFLRTRLFEPAGLTRTVVGDAIGDPDRAEAYEPGDDGKLQPAHAIDMSVPYAAGAIRSTANDLVRWDRFLRKGELLTQATQARMWETEEVTAQSGSGYGYGWLVTKNKDTIVHHGGGIDGFSTYYLRAIESDLVLVVYANNSGGATGAIKEVMVKVAFGGKAPEDTGKGPVALDPAETTKLIGTYAITPESIAAAKKVGLTDEILATIKTMEVRQAGDNLVVDPAGQEATGIFRESANTYVAPSVKAKLVFEYEAGADKAARFVLSQGGLTLTFVRP